MNSRIHVLVTTAALIVVALAVNAGEQIAGTPGPQDLTIAANRQTAAVVAVSPDAGTWEKRAAADLVYYIRQMTGAEPKLADTPAAIAAALAGQAPVLVVGRAAVEADPSLQAALSKAAKPAPVLRADAIVLKRHGNRVYLAGANDDCHYYAAAELLRRWGCRWYMPGEFGECIPRHAALKVGKLDYAYGPPFEARHYWLSWIGDNTGRARACSTCRSPRTGRPSTSPSRCCPSSPRARTSCSAWKTASTSPTRVRTRS